MAKKAKQKGYSFTAWPFRPKTGLTMPARLGKYKTPPPMVGNNCAPLHSWHAYSEYVYSEMMVAKRGGWSNAAYQQAREDNERIDNLLERRDEDYETAWAEKEETEFSMLQDQVSDEYLGEYIAA